MNGNAPGPLELFVPGRLCLVGEHSDWSGAMKKYNHNIESGCTIVVGLTYGLYARVKPIQDAKVLKIKSTTDIGEIFETELQLDEHTLAQEAQGGGFFSYVAGVAYIFATEYHIGGLEIDNYQTTLPLKKGLSSSAAMCVLVARSFNQVYNLGLTVRGEMQAAFYGERMTPSQCGRMDQVLAFGTIPVIMRFNADILTVQPLKLYTPLYLVLVDLKSKKNTVRILEALQQAFPHPQNDQERSVVDLLGKENTRITQLAQNALEAGDAQALGAVMTEAQRLFDDLAGPLCPDELGVEGSPVLHKVLYYPAIQEYIYGGKGVGSQGDGSAQLLCKSAEAQDKVVKILEADLGVHCLRCDLQPC